MIEYDDDRWRLDDAAIAQRENELASIQEALESCDDFQVRQLLATEERHIMTELETGYAQPLDVEED